MTKQKQIEAPKQNVDLPIENEITLPVETTDVKQHGDRAITPAYFDRIEQGGYATPQQEALYRERQVMNSDRTMFMEALGAKHEVFARQLGDWKTYQLAQFEAMQGLQSKQLEAMTTMQTQNIEYQLEKATADIGSGRRVDQSTRVMNSRNLLGEGVRNMYSAANIINLS